MKESNHRRKNCYNLILNCLISKIVFGIATILFDIVKISVNSCSGEWCGPRPFCFWTKCTWWWKVYFIPKLLYVHLYYSYINRYNYIYTLSLLYEFYMPAYASRNPSFWLSQWWKKKEFIYFFLGGGDDNVKG